MDSDTANNTRMEAERAINRKEPTKEQRIEAQLSNINSKAGIDLTYSKQLNGYRLHDRGMSDLSLRMPAKEFLEMLTVIDNVINEMKRGRKS